METEEKTPAYLIKTDGRIFAWTAILAARKDMKPYYGEMPGAKQKTETTSDVTVSMPEAPTITLSELAEPPTFKVLDDAETQKLLQIIDAIDRLDPLKGFTRGGVPDLNELRKILDGLPISAADRDAAWTMKKETEPEEGR